MSIGMKRAVVITALVVIGFVLGRLGVRAFMNTLLGGTLVGGNFL